VIFGIERDPFGDSGDPINILRLGNVAYIQDQQGNLAPFEVAIAGHSGQVERGMFTEYAEVGATWRLESLHGYHGSMEKVLARAKKGPHGNFYLHTLGRRIYW